MNKRLLIGGSAFAAILVAIGLVSLMARNRVSPEERKLKAYNTQALEIYGRASDLLAQADLGGAMPLYQDIVQDYPLSTSASLAYMALGDIALKSDSLIEAKQFYKTVVDKFPGDKVAIDAQEKLEEVNMKLLFSPVVTADSTLYTIKPGDTLSAIAKKFDTTVELIQKSNNISGSIIRPMRKLKISIAKYSVLVDKSQNTLTLKSNGEVLKVYKVSTGSNNSTPTGKFKIINKLKDPVWYKAGAIVPADSPENVLGSRWMGLDEPGYGIHGSTEPETIGRQITAGCIRMYNGEVEELYSIIPAGTEVTIVD